MRLFLKEDGMSERPYLDFKLYLTKPADPKYACQVSLLPTAEIGESMRPVNVPVEKAPKSLLLKKLARKSIGGPELLQLGKSLADCLIPEGEIRRLFREAYKYCGIEQGLRLRLIIADDTLRTWPWEYVYFNHSGGKDGWAYFLALEPRISIVRHEPLATRHSKLHAEGQDVKALRLFLATAEPKDWDPLDLEHEVEKVKATLSDFIVDGVRIQLDPILENTTRGDLLKWLQRKRPISMFHFSGHGTVKTLTNDFTLEQEKHGYILLVKDAVSKAEDPLEAEELANMLSQAGVRIVVLGACL